MNQNDIDVVSSAYNLTEIVARMLEAEYNLVLTLEEDDELYEFFLKLVEREWGERSQDADEDDC